jgi:hypothetical protein
MNFLPFGIGLPVVIASVSVVFFHTQYDDLMYFPEEFYLTNGVTILLYIPYFIFRQRFPLRSAFQLVVGSISLCVWIIVIIVDSSANYVGVLYGTWGTIEGAAFIAAILSFRKLRMTREADRIQHLVESATGRFESFRHMFEIERTKLTRIMEEIQKDYEAQANAMIRTERELREIRVDFDRYEAIKKLSPKQQDILYRSKKYDIWVGIVTGIISSGAVALIVLWLTQGRVVEFG